MRMLRSATSSAQINIFICKIQVGHKRNNSYPAVEIAGRDLKGRRAMPRPVKEFVLPVAQVKWEQIIFSGSGFNSTNIRRMNSRAAMASLRGPVRDFVYYRFYTQFQKTLYSGNTFSYYYTITTTLSSFWYAA